MNKNIKVLSIKQPWADLIAYGHKKIELRTWKTDYRGKIAIHASKGDSVKHVYNALTEIYPALFKIWDDIHPSPIGHVKGAIIATAFLDDVFRYENECQYNDIGNFGRLAHLCPLNYFNFVPYGWCLRSVSLLNKPIPSKGRLGLWEFPLIDRKLAEKCEDFLRGK